MADVVFTEQELTDIRSQFSEVAPAVYDSFRPYDLTRRVFKEDESLKETDKIGGEMAAFIQEWMKSKFGGEFAVSFGHHAMVKSVNFFSDYDLSQSTLLRWQSTANMQYGCIVIPLELFYYLYNKFLGGVLNHRKSGVLTPLEEKVRATICLDLLAIQEKVWGSPRTDWKFSEGTVLKMMSEIESVSWPDEFIIGQYDVVLGDSKFQIIITFPKSILKSLSGLVRMRSKVADKAWTSIVRKLVVDIPVNVKALLGNVDLKFQQVLTMQPGDVYPLQIFEGSFPVLINGRSQWQALAGVSGEQQAIKLSGEVNHGERDAG